jgi:hypothetical protein
MVPSVSIIGSVIVSVPAQPGTPARGTLLAAGGTGRTTAPLWTAPALTTNEVVTGMFEAGGNYQLVVLSSGATINVQWHSSTHDEGLIVGYLKVVSLFVDQNQPHHPYTIAVAVHCGCLNSPYFRALLQHIVTDPSL